MRKQVSTKLVVLKVFPKDPHIQEIRFLQPYTQLD